MPPARAPSWPHVGRGPCCPCRRADHAHGSQWRPATCLVQPWGTGLDRAAYVRYSAGGWRNYLMRDPVAFIVGLIGFNILMATPALACQGTTTVLDDKFSSIDSAWANLSTYNGKIESGHLILDVPAQVPPADYVTHVFNQSDIYTDVNVCVNFSFDATQAPNSTSFGIVFWGLDDNSYYNFEVSPTGSFSVFRKVGDTRYLYPIPWTATPLAKKELNQSQEIEINMKQNTAELFLNGSKIADFKGNMPSGGGEIGMWYGLPSSGGRISVSEFLVKK